MNLEIVVVGRVQGVGYRPFIRGVAEELRLSGLVRNCGGFVQIFVSGEKPTLQTFLKVLSTKCPNGAHITGIHIRKAGEDGLTYTHGFSIGPSIEDSSFHPIPPADVSICETCSAELMNEKDRRYRYPFISCTSCGPRFSILNDLPYDREQITMSAFPMCSSCQTEYDGTGRRSHAQTISCHDCGPQLLLATADQSLTKEKAFEEAVRMLKAGRVLAVKGIGGYQLVCVAANEEAVLSIRSFKCRGKKPLAVMFHSLSDIRSICHVSDQEAALLTSPARPIVLLQPIQANFSKSIVGDSRRMGVFLPYTGLHLMLTESCGPLIVTSLNRTDDPIIFRDEDVPKPSKEVPHGILYHEREIVTPLDDSVVQVIGERTQFIRRSRGYAPTPVFLKDKTDATIFATGGDLKSTFCLLVGEHAYVSQYLGDLEPYSTQRNYRAEYSRMTRLLGLTPTILVKDMHPDYYSGRMVALSTDSKSEQEIILETKIEEENGHSPDFGYDEGYTDELIPMDDDREPYADRLSEPVVNPEKADEGAVSAIVSEEKQIQPAPETASSDVHIQVEVIDDTFAMTDPTHRVNDQEIEQNEADDFPERTRDESMIPGQDDNSDCPETMEEEFTAETTRTEELSDEVPILPKVKQVLSVQHHHAHIASVMAEHHLPSCIGVAFDGTGYGTDGHIWGGEFLLVNGSSFTRETHLANIRIVGGDIAAKRPDTTAYCYLAATGEDMRHEDSDLLRAALRNKTLTVKTSSMGRLFDAVSCVLEISDQNTFEGESAILLENAAAEALECEVAPFSLHFAKARDKDEGMPDAAAIVRDIRYAYLVGIDRRALAYAFHEAIAEMTVNECEKIRAKDGENRVALAGGVFANAILTEMITKGLQENAFSVYMNEALPPNDGSICLGQAWIAALRRKGL